MLRNAVKERLKNGQTVKGVFMGLNSPPVVEMIADAGFDCVIIDTEHGSLPIDKTEAMVRAAELRNITPIVRVGYGPSDIQQALDCGAHGIHVPMVNTKEDAEAVIEKAKFPPLGNRGAAYSVRSSRYGFEKGKEYLENANRETFVAFHIETPQAVDNIEQIISVPGLDVCFIGTTDLSVSMGYAAEGPSHPEVQSAVNHVLHVAKQKGITVGKYVASGPEFQPTFEWGAPYGAISITAIITKALKETVNPKSLTI